MSQSSRRTFLKAAAATGAAAAASWSTAAGAPMSQAAAGRSVAVLGAGVAGLTAAHELVERGFDVTVYERKALGGKARSMPVPDSATGGRRPLPAEHGFRFFPGFYHDLGDTLRRIPFDGNANGCWDNLTRATSYLGARAGGRADLTIPFPEPLPPQPFPYTPASFTQSLQSIFETGYRLPPQEVAFFVQKALVYGTSCDERRLGQWDDVTWHDYIRADRMSDEYRAFLGDGMIRNLSAIKSKDASTHSIGLVGETTAWSALGRGNEPGSSVDRVLDGPTSERWLDPWIARLRAAGVRFEVGWTAAELQVTGGRIGSVLLRDGAGQSRSVSADWIVSAMPVERFQELLSSQLLAADPKLASIRKLRHDWMNGLMFYLKQELPITPGHVNYVDSGWAITSISQQQFWRRPFAETGDGSVRECLSTILSDWSSPGMFTERKAKESTPEQIAAEVWREMKAHLNDTGDTGDEVLTDEMLHSWFLDPAIIDPGSAGVRNDEPLFIQSPGSWADRPQAATGIGNLFLAGDWIRTHINVTTMEGANQGGRMAANAVLAAAGSGGTKAQLTPLFQPPEFEPFKLIDRQRYRLGLPNQFDLLDPRAP